MRRKVRGRRRSAKGRGSIRRIILVAAILLIATSALTFYTVYRSRGTTKNNVEYGKLRAIILDGLATTIPNKPLIDSLVRMLQAKGFEVSVYSGRNVTVEAFKEAISGKYRLIIFRVHGGYLQTAEGSNLGTHVAILTAEPYDRSRYAPDQSMGALAIGEPFMEPEKKYFAATSNFIRIYGGNMKHSIVIVASCYGLYGEDLATAFLKKGASAFISWRGPVDPYTNDVALKKLISNLVEGNMSLYTAIREAQKGLETLSHLSIYPQTAGKYTIWEIVKPSSEPSG